MKKTNVENQALQDAIKKYIEVTRKLMIIITLVFGGLALFFEVKKNVEPLWLNVANAILFAIIIALLVTLIRSTIWSFHNKLKVYFSVGLPLTVTFALAFVSSFIIILVEWINVTSRGVSLYNMLLITGVVLFQSISFYGQGYLVANGHWINIEEVEQITIKKGLFKQLTLVIVLKKQKGQKIVSVHEKLGELLQSEKSLKKKIHG